MPVYVLLVLILTGVFLFQLHAQSDEQNKEQQCCFTNPSYSGVCTVNPSEDETCNSVLKYLNTPGTVGKTYCGNSQIRGGWKSVSCDQE